MSIVQRVMAASGRRTALVGFFAAFVGLAGLFSMPPLDRDEARFAQATAQMLETRNFVTIRFLDEERNKKPVGIHWLQAGSVALFSDVEAREVWAYRIPSVLGLVIAAVCVARLGETLFSPAAGVLAGLLMAAAPVAAAEATIAKTDAMLLATVTAAMLALASILSRRMRGEEAGWLRPLGLWFATGAGVLLKGPIILIVLASALIGCALRLPEARLLRAIRPMSGLGVLVVMIAPWALAINAATEGRFFAEAVGGDMLAKVGAPQESHWGPPGYHLVLLFVLFWPAAALLGAGARQAFRERKNWRFFFLIAWTLPPWLLFELTATKLPHYTLPLYPALALAAAAAATGREGQTLDWVEKGGVAVFAGVGVLFAFAIALAPSLDGEVRFAPGPAVAALLFISGVGLATRAFLRAERVVGGLASAALSAAFAWALLNFLLPNAAPLTLSSRLAALVDEAGLHEIRDGAAPAILSGYTEPSAVFLLGSGTRLAAGGAAAELAATNGAGAIVVDGRTDDAFLAHAAGVGLDLTPIGTIEGLNYSNGEDVRLTIYAAP